MTYTLAGLSFTFVQNGSGGVYKIVTPDIPLGVFTLASYELNFDPALTVQGAQDVVTGLLGMLGVI